MAWKDLDTDVAELFAELQPDLEGALYRAWKRRLGKRKRARDEELTFIRAARAARRAARMIPPVGRPPELEAKIQKARVAMLKAMRRRKIAAAASLRLAERERVQELRQPVEIA